MNNPCIVYSFNKKYNRYPNEQELETMGQSIPKFVQKCKDCTKYLNSTCNKDCIYKD